MTEYSAMIQLCLALGALAVTLFTLAILVLLYGLLKRALEQQRNPSFTSASSSPAFTSAAALVSARKTERAEKPEKPEKPPKPGRSCGHCGTRIKTDPVKGLVIEEQSYLVYACPDCKKQTLLVQ